MGYPIDATLAAGDYGTGLSGNYIPEIWSGKLLEKFYTATVFTAISNTDYEGEISSQGDKVIIRTVPAITISEYKVGMTLNYERPKGDTVELLIDKGKYFGFVINDVEKKQADVAYVDKWAEDASEQMKINIDRGILADIPADSHADNAGAASGKISGSVELGAAAADGSAAIALAKTTIIDKVVECGLVLDEQDVPETGRWMVLPSWACTRIKLSELKDASLTGDGKSTLRNGRTGMIDRFEIFNSNNIIPVTEGSVKCYNSIFGHKSALTFASQLTENELIPNPNDFGKLMRGLQVYGYEVIHPESMGTLYCKAA
ncbi:MAG: hypothetical protein JEZ12_15995 [Desulfobacterium sp.]|nr:hypothetical protein [Desulfobacterium sp.]